MGEDPVEDHYDAIAGSWEEFVRVPTKRQVLWPAVRSLLPAVDGRRVLDAGCGNGHYSAWLADRGAAVVGVDASEGMVEEARDRYGEAVEFRHADLRGPLAFTEDGQFDLVLCQHVFSHLPDLDPTVAEFARVLDAGGTVVASTHHPFHDFQVVADREYPDLSDAWGRDYDPVVVPDSEPDYHETQRFEIHWGGPDSENPGVYYRRPLDDLLGAFRDAGFTVGTVVEPSPGEAFEREYPEAARALRGHPPRSLCLRAEL